ncbi:hypothetical protein quinque_009524 [Culex quinquefasciatus]
MILRVFFGKSSIRKGHFFAVDLAKLNETAENQLLITVTGREHGGMELVTIIRKPVAVIGSPRVVFDTEEFICG